MEVKIAGIERHSFVNGPGTRYVIFFQGCPHHCHGCQNPDTWNIKGGTSYNSKDLIEDILHTKYLDGVTFSGGDPLFQAKACLEIAKELKKNNINIWCYTGWTYEAILAGNVSKEAIQVLENIDVLIDGPFLLAQLSTDCLYRGSRNQRLIDAKESLKQGNVVEEEEISYQL